MTETIGPKTNTPEEKTSENQKQETSPSGSFVDISTEEIVSSLSPEEQDLVEKHWGLFNELNQQTEKKTRSGIVNKRVQDGGLNYEEGEKVRNIVEKLKTKYS